MNKTDKIKEAQVLLDNIEHYNLVRQPMVKDTQQRVNQIITQLHQGNHIDDMTAKWLSQTPSPPRVPMFYTLYFLCYKLNKYVLILNCRRIYLFPNYLTWL